MFEPTDGESIPKSTFDGILDIAEILVAEKIYINSNAAFYMCTC